MGLSTSVPGVWRACHRSIAITLAVGLAIALVALAPQRASADDVVTPPPMRSHSPVPIVDVHGAAIVPLVDVQICPPGAQCVLGPGVGLGASVELRFPDRFAIIGAYDFGLVDSDSVYEIGALHAVRGGFRYVIDDASRVHPYLDVLGGFIAFGDTSTVATAGGVVCGGVGLELELSESVAITGSASAWLLLMAPFTARDRVLRASPTGADLVLQITLGVSVAVGPLTEP